MSKLFLKNKWKILFLHLMLCASMSAQISVGLKQMDSVSSTEQCYQIYLKSVDSQDHILGGQNYRLYYNSESALLNEKSIQSLLPESYLPIQVVQHFFDVDASGFGNLSFDGRLGFINLSTDFDLTRDRGLILSKDLDVPVASLCFNVHDHSQPEIVWAQDKLTNTYATAFVEVAVLDLNLVPIKSSIDHYYVQHNDVLSSQEGNIVNYSIFPNPFKDKLHIQFNETLKSDALATVMDVFGQLVGKYAVSKGSNSITISGETIPHGALIVTITTDDGNQSSIKAIKIK